MAYSKQEAQYIREVIKHGIDASLEHPENDFYGGDTLLVAHMDYVRRHGRPNFDTFGLIFEAQRVLQAKELEANPADIRDELLDQHGEGILMGDMQKLRNRFDKQFEPAVRDEL